MNETECIFCRIVRGELPCQEIYASDTVLAFLDIAPVHFGHTLVIPREHYTTVFDIPKDLGRELLEAQQKVGQAVMAATRADGLNIGMNNYSAAGQVVFHAHYHLIPRYVGDKLTLWPQSPYPDEQTMENLAQSIRSSLG